MSEGRIGDVAGGGLVVAALAGEPVLCLKAQRLARDYVNHYLVPLAPLPGGLRGMALVYVDPEATAIPAAATALTLDAASTAAAEVGDVVVTPAGRFLKVFDTARTERHFCYVDLDSGDIRPRQERGVAAVLAWRLERGSAG